MRRASLFSGLGLLLLSLCIDATAQRMEIDRLEGDFRGSYNSREAYELSQKFILIDSTYYTGYFFEGMYRFFRASDLLGYELAIKPLKKSIELMEKDFPGQLRRIRDIQAYINVYLLQRKYAIMCDLLARCYSHTGELDKSVAVARKLIKRNFVYNWGVSPYSHLSWVHHKNRVYTPEEHAFLAPTIEGNVQLASKYADSILIHNRKNYRFITDYIPSGYGPVQGIYFHYKDIIYSYLLKVDSAEYCAERLRRFGTLSYNNYGNLQFIQGKFEKAERNYAKERGIDGYENKETKEFDYMQSVINIFKNELDTAKLLVRRSLDMMGPAPGYGWNNIAMARAFYYSGDLAKAKEHRDIAANFKELHINSTWGKVQYDRNSLLFEFLYHKQKMNEIKFLNRNYWYTPADLMDLAGHYFKKENAHLLLTSELSANPERFLVLYNLFASENTIFFDEIWALIKHFNPEFFIDLFEKKLQENTRPGVKRYFDYFIAQFYLEDDKPDLAIEWFNRILDEPSLDKNYEKLLLARVYEGMSKAHEALDQPEESANFLLEFYRTFPQLVPYSSLTMKMQLDVKTLDHPKAQRVHASLDDVEVDWVDDSAWPSADVSFEESEDGFFVNYRVTDSSGRVKHEGAINANKYGNPGAELIFRLFGIKRELN